jgi:ketol-acid reductoisomerase
MRGLVREITSGAFADEWDRERDAGHPSLAQLREVHASADQAAFENAVRESFEPR